MPLIRRGTLVGFCLFLGAQRALAAAPVCEGLQTSLEQTRCYLARIAALDASGPALHSVLALDKTAEAQARAMDSERLAGKTRGPLHGAPILVKDNIETRGVATTAGSLALVANDNDRDAPLVTRLREAGAVILGKTNLSEWANIRSTSSASGWSALGGLVKNPYALDRSACGSSSGSGAAVAANLAFAAIGTETDGSITCPAAVNGIVGLKPTVGLVSRRHIIPISQSQDTAGPMARTVTDAARVLTAIAGSDPGDPRTRDADAHRSDYAAAFRPDALRGARIGVLRYTQKTHHGTSVVFDQALEALTTRGAVLVDITVAPAELWASEEVILLTELKAGMNTYLEGTTPNVKTRSLADVIAFNAKTPAELRYFGQELFEKAQATTGLDGAAYKSAVRSAKAAKATLDGWLAKYHLDALVAPTTAPAWTSDLIDGDHFLGEVSSLPAIAGYPHLTVPMGNVEGLPVGISFIGAAWSEGRLLALGYAFEQHTQARRAPTFAEHIP